MFQSEVHAQEAHWQKIHSDCQAALKVESKLVWNCLCLEDLAHWNEVTLKWLPGHHGISGNEAEDLLARVGQTGLFTSPQLFQRLSNSHFREVVDTWEWEAISFTEHRSNWSQTSLASYNPDGS